MHFENNNSFLSVCSEFSERRKLKCANNSTNVVFVLFSTTIQNEVKWVPLPSCWSNSRNWLYLTNWLSWSKHSDYMKFCNFPQSIFLPTKGNEELFRKACLWYFTLFIERTILTFFLWYSLFFFFLCSCEFSPRESERSCWQWLWKYFMKRKEGVTWKLSRIWMISNRYFKKV